MLSSWLRTDVSPAMGETATLEVDGVSVRFAGIAALSDVSFSMASKQIYGLIGPNGAGKTTLVNCLSGYQRPTEGKITLGGLDVTDWRPARLRRAGIARTFQAGRLFGRLTVYENVEAGLLGLGMTRRAAAARVSEVLDMLDIRVHTHRPNLSAKTFTSGNSQPNLLKGNHCV